MTDSIYPLNASRTMNKQYWSSGISHQIIEAANRRFFQRFPPNSYGVGRRSCPPSDDQCSVFALNAFCNGYKWNDLATEESAEGDMMDTACQFDETRCIPQLGIGLMMRSFPAKWMHQWRRGHERLMLIIVFSAIGWTLFGNGLCLLAFRNQIKHRQKPYLHQIAIVLGDIILGFCGIVYFLLDEYLEVHQRNGYCLYYWWLPIISWATAPILANMIILLGAVWDRIQALSQPLEYRTIDQKRRVLRLTLGAYGFAGLVSAIALDWIGNLLKFNDPGDFDQDQAQPNVNAQLFCKLQLHSLRVIGNWRPWDFRGRPIAEFYSTDPNELSLLYMERFGGWTGKICWVREDGWFEDYVQIGLRAVYGIIVIAVGGGIVLFNVRLFYVFLRGNRRSDQQHRPRARTSSSPVTPLTTTTTRTTRTSRHQTSSPPTVTIASVPSDGHQQQSRWIGPRPRELNPNPTTNGNSNVRIRANFVNPDMIQVSMVRLNQDLTSSNVASMSNNGSSTSARSTSTNTNGTQLTRRKTPLNNHHDNDRDQLNHKKLIIILTYQSTLMVLCVFSVILAVLRTHIFPAYLNKVVIQAAYFLNLIQLSGNLFVFLLISSHFRRSFRAILFAVIPKRLKTCTA